MLDVDLKPAPGTLKSAAIILIVVLIPSSIATAIGGEAAGMAFGLAAGLVMAVSPYATNAQAIGSAVLTSALAALAVLAGTTPWAVALLMMASAILLALTNQHSAGLMTLAPIVVIIMGPAGLDLTWSQAMLYVFAGGIFGWLVVRIFKFDAVPMPVPQAVAWRHAIVLGVLTAASLYWSLANNVPHGYWIAVTLLMALRPLPEQRKDTLTARLLGTLLGAMIALVVIVVLPTQAAVAVAAVCLLLLAAYSMSGNYFLQTMFLTPMLLIFTTLGDQSEGVESSVERVVFTVVGVALGVVAAVVLERWDRRDMPVTDHEPHTDSVPD